MMCAENTTRGYTTSVQTYEEYNEYEDRNESLHTLLFYVSFEVEDDRNESFTLCCVWFEDGDDPKMFVSGRNDYILKLKFCSDDLKPETFHVTVTVTCVRASDLSRQNAEAK
jgi:hypothetical protein